MQLLAGYAFWWEYRLGKANVADPLSRNLALAPCVRVGGYVAVPDGRSAGHGCAAGTG